MLLALKGSILHLEVPFIITVKWWLYDSAFTYHEGVPGTSPVPAPQCSSLSDVLGI